MTDDTLRRSRPDSERINTREQYEINYWTRALGVSSEELLSAVKAVGDSEKEVRQYLGRRQASDSSRPSRA